MRRALATALALVIAAMAAAAQRVWDGTKWVARALSGMPTPPSTAIEDAFDDVVQGTRPVTPSAPTGESVTPSAPAPAPQAKAAPVAVASAEVIELDPVLVKGKIAHAFACALATQDEEPSTNGLHEGEAAWLNSLNHLEMMHIYRAGPMRVGAHMAGIRPIEGLPLCPTEAEYRHALGSGAQITPRAREEIREWQETLDQAFEDMISDPAYELKCGV
jgi:hypothetical protein